jgi:Recombinase
MDSVALMPTQGPINSWCGSLDFELENGRYTMGFISRTDAKWLASAIHGDPKRDSGILNNPLYIGRLVWNRRQMKKRPRTSKRVAMMGTAADQIVREEPTLRIISDELWSE